MAQPTLSDAQERLIRRLTILHRLCEEDVKYADRDGAWEEKTTLAEVIRYLSAGQWRPTHHHVKRGTDYRVIGTALLQASETVGEAATLVIYEGENGRLWARPEVEFDDGRFEPLPKPPASDRPLEGRDGTPDAGPGMTTKPLSATPYDNKEPPP